MAFKRSFAVLFVLAASVLASPHNQPSKPTPSKDSCKSNEFWYTPKSCCLPHGGPPKPPPPPPGKSCPPTNWYWHKDNSCCVPVKPPPSNPPPPQCSKGWGWNKGTQCCEPHGTPPTTTSKPSQTPKAPGYPGHSGGGYTPPPSPKGHGGGGYTPPSPPKSQPAKGGYGQSAKGHKKRSATPLCPRSFEACPVGGLTGSEYECLDTTAELQSCGGCSSTGKGQDCTAIEGAWNVGCETGSCAVYTCALGYKVADDGKSCIEN